MQLRVLGSGHTCGSLLQLACVSNKGEARTPCPPSYTERKHAASLSGRFWWEQATTACSDSAVRMLETLGL